MILAYHYRKDNNGFCKRSELTHNCYVNPSVDGTLLTVHDNGVKRVVRKINCELKNISKWLKLTKLKLNTSQTKAMVRENRSSTVIN